MEWERHLSTWQWKQGDHITLLGPTGSGKTTLARALLPKRRFVLFLATKPKDVVINKLRKEGYKVTKDWPTYGERIVFWPNINKFADVANQRAEIRRVMSDVYEAGGWTLYLDEALYITQFLKMQKEMELLWYQGRSLGITIVAATQRPRHLPLAAYSQASHLYIWKTRDKTDLKRLSEISGNLDVREIERNLQALPKHCCLYVDGYGTIQATKAPI